MCSQYRAHVCTSPEVWVDRPQRQMELKSPSHGTLPLLLDARKSRFPCSLSVCRALHTSSKYPSGELYPRLWKLLYEKPLSWVLCPLAWGHCCAHLSGVAMCSSCGIQMFSAQSLIGRDARSCPSPPCMSSTPNCMVRSLSCRVMDPFSLSKQPGLPCT